jgi:hypothetical protein
MAFLKLLTIRAVKLGQHSCTMREVKWKLVSLFPKNQWGLHDLDTDRDQIPIWPGNTG